jgi:hypothetical protein
MGCFDKSFFVLSIDDTVGISKFIEIMCTIFINCGKVQFVKLEKEFKGSDLDKLTDGVQEIPIDQKSMEAAVEKLKEKYNGAIYRSFLVNYFGSANSRAQLETPEATSDFWKSIGDMNIKLVDEANKIINFMEKRANLNGRDLALSCELELTKSDLLPVLKYIHETNKKFKITRVHFLKKYELVNFCYSIPDKDQEYSLLLSPKSIETNALIYQFDIDDGFVPIFIGLLPEYQEAFDNWVKGGKKGSVFTKNILEEVVA